MKSTEAGPGLPPTVSHARALEVASDAGDLHAVEELMIDLMRRGTGREDDTTGDIAAMLVDAAIEACRLASAGTPDASRATATLIRRTCNANGTLLKPSKPLTTIDRLILLGEDSHEAPNVVASYDGESHAVSCGHL